MIINGSEIELVSYLEVISLYSTYDESDEVPIVSDTLSHRNASRRIWSSI